MLIIIIHAHNILVITMNVRMTEILFSFCASYPSSSSKEPSACFHTVHSFFTITGLVYLSVLALLTYHNSPYKAFHSSELQRSILIVTYLSSVHYIQHISQRLTSSYPHSQMKSLLTLSRRLLYRSSMPLRFLGLVPYDFNSSSG